MDFRFLDEHTLKSPRRARPRSRRLRGCDDASHGRDAGLSLVEVLVSIVLLAVAGTAVLGAMAISITGSTVSRTQASGVVWLQSAADYMSTTAFVDCVVGSEAQVATQYQNQLQQATAPRSPAGWPQPNLTVVAPVLFWSAGGFGSTCNPTSGIQQITISVTDQTRNRTVRMVTVKTRPSA